MQLNSEIVKFRDDSEIVVTEADYPTNIKLDQMTDEVEKNPVEDSFQQEFRKLYPTLAACSSGDVPSSDKMLNMLETSPDDIDNWYRAVRRLNPDWFGFESLEEKTEVVKFRDGTTLTVTTSHLPSVGYKIGKIAMDSNNLKLEDPRELVFMTNVYPKMAGCSFGDVPSKEDAYHYPSVELNKWYEAVNRINPQLFAAVEEAAGIGKITKKKETKPQT